MIINATSPPSVAPTVPTFGQLADEWLQTYPALHAVGNALSDASLRTGLLAIRLILQRAVRTKQIAANPMH